MSDKTTVTEEEAINIYDDMLDEYFSFKDVGGIFSNMLPSRVLMEVDPIAYHCGFSDWLDSSDFIVEGF